jgi:hypothetical protein
LTKRGYIVTVYKNRKKNNLRGMTLIAYGNLILNMKGRSRNDKNGYQTVR